MHALTYLHTSTYTHASTYIQYLHTLTLTYTYTQFHLPRHTNTHQNYQTSRSSIISYSRTHTYRNIHIICWWNMDEWTIASQWLADNKLCQKNIHFMMPLVTHKDLRRCIDWLSHRIFTLDNENLYPQKWKFTNHEIKYITNFRFKNATTKFKNKLGRWWKKINYSIP